MIASDVPPPSDTKAFRQWLIDQVQHIRTVVDAMAARCEEREARIRRLEINGAVGKTNQRWATWIIKWIILPLLLTGSTFAGGYWAQRLNGPPAPPSRQHPAS